MNTQQVTASKITELPLNDPYITPLMLLDGKKYKPVCYATGSEAYKNVLNRKIHYELKT